MGTDKTVQILLSTYNGEKYLREQLESFVTQTIFPDISVLIRDDGSTDGTGAILRQYAEAYGFRVEYGTNIGVTRSYLWLIEHADDACSYFAFSDQDDVWLPKKLEKTIAEFETMDKQKPRMVATLSEIVDENLAHLGFSQRAGKGASFFNAMVQNICPGHTQIIDRKLRETLLKTTDSCAILVMDWWIYLVASGVGTVKILPEATVLHRQHGNNTVGYRTTFWELLPMRLRRLHGKEAAAMTRQLDAALRCYGTEFAEECCQELKYFLAGLSSMKRRIEYVRHARIYRQTEIETAIVKVLYVLGKYHVKNGQK